jgi:hypothetical protein
MSKGVFFSPELRNEWLSPAGGIRGSYSTLLRGGGGGAASAVLNRDQNPMIMAGWKDHSETGHNCLII